MKQMSDTETQILIIDGWPSPEDLTGKETGKDTDNQLDSVNRSISNLCSLDVVSSFCQTVIWLVWYYNTLNPLLFLASCESIAMMAVYIQLKRRLVAKEVSEIDLHNFTLFVNLNMGGFYVLFGLACLLKNYILEDLHMGYLAFLTVCSSFLYYQKRIFINESGTHTPDVVQIYLRQQHVSLAVYFALLISCIVYWSTGDVSLNKELLMIVGGIQVYVFVRI